jgi:transposase
MKEEKRLEVLQSVYRGERTRTEAAMIIGISERQCYRIKARVEQERAPGVVNGNRGRPSEHKIKKKAVERIVELARRKDQVFDDRRG